MYHREISAPTAITILIRGPRALANLTINYGDGVTDTFTSDQISTLEWHR